jgi:hypothetical protein
VLALLIFHARVGVRVAARAFIPLFCAMLAWVIVQMYPAALVRGLALGLFAPSPSRAILAGIALLSVWLPAWGVRRLAVGLGGWVRHLPVGDSRHRRGLELSLIIVQLPLRVALVLLALVAHLNGATLWQPVLLRLGVVAASGALAALPVRRGWLVGPVGLGCSAAGALGTVPVALAAVPVLLCAEGLAGSIRLPGPSRRRESDLPFASGIAWRALGWRTIAAVIGSLLPLVCAWLFVTNNELEGVLAAGAWRFGICSGVVVVTAILSESLAVRRPVWPWLRSLPSSSLRRVVEDVTFLAIHAAPVLAVGAFFDGWAAAAALTATPLIAARAAGSMRRVRGGSSATRTLVAEACLVAALLALLPWSAVAWPVLAVGALARARQDERTQKVTRWFEAHHDSAGDSLSWSGR